MNRKSAVKSAVVAALALGVALVGTGCNPECVDKYDCLADAKVGSNFTCENNRCVKQASTAVDAGTP